MHRPALLPSVLLATSLAARAISCPLSAASILPQVRRSWPAQRAACLAPWAASQPSWTQARRAAWAPQVRCGAAAAGGMRRAAAACQGYARRLWALARCPAAVPCPPPGSAAGPPAGLLRARLCRIPGRPRQRSRVPRLAGPGRRAAPCGSSWGSRGVSNGSGSRGRRPGTAAGGLPPVCEPLDGRPSVYMPGRPAGRLPKHAAHRRAGRMGWPTEPAAQLQPACSCSLHCCPGVHGMGARLPAKLPLCASQVASRPVLARCTPHSPAPAVTARARALEASRASLDTWAWWCASAAAGRHPACARAAWRRRACAATARR